MENLRFFAGSACKFAPYKSEPMRLLNNYTIFRDENKELFKNLQYIEYCGGNGINLCGKLDCLEKRNADGIEALTE